MTDDKADGDYNNVYLNKVNHRFVTHGGDEGNKESKQGNKPYKEVPSQVEIS